MSDQIEPSDHTDGPRVIEPEAGAIFEPYDEPAGGWGALRAVAVALREQSVVLKGTQALLSMNQPHGFDCPGCAWPDPRHTSSFEFCENGAKAVSFELTKRRVGRDFFAAHTVTELAEHSDYWLEEQGRLTEPMRYDRSTDHYVPIGWDDAFAMIASHLNALDSPDRAEFYTSGRASNEAAFLYSIFVRRFGTNNFPDCSNMCHEATSVGLPMSIGIGKGTVLLEDFDATDAIFVIGQNPGTNSPRMMTSLHNASRRGVPIVAINPLRERALERFAAPQAPIEMVTLSSTRIASEYCQVKVGGDLAVLKGIMKLVLEAHAEAIERGDPPVLDLPFIETHTTGFEALAEDIRAASWDEILTQFRRRACTNRADRAHLYRGEVVHHRLWHGDHPAPPGHPERAADRQSAADAGQLRQAGRRNLSGARPFQCSGRSNRRNHGDSERGAPGADREGFLVPAPEASWACRRRRRRSDDRRPRRGVRRAWRQLRRGHAGYRKPALRHATAQTDGRHQHQAESRSRRSRSGGIDPSLSRAQRRRYPGDRSPERDGRGQHVHGARVRRPLHPTLAASEIGSRHHMRHGACELCRRAASVGRRSRGTTI